MLLQNLKTPTDILRSYWGYREFRPMQEEIINSVIQGNDTLALLPTGGGKSLCFQVPGLLLEGVCIVITPLIALMKDQVEELKKRNIKAAAIFAGMSKSEIDITLDNFIYSDYKFLYLSPERLHTELVKVRVKKMKVGLLVVDEAHCISQWGHDFRPTYLQIPKFKEFLPKCPVIAVTATATERTKNDIISFLFEKKPQIFTQSFARNNLSFSAFEVEIKDRKIVEILTKTEGSAIVYVKTRKRTIEIANVLLKAGISADAYHAGMDNVARFKKQELWQKNQIRVIVATNAFGMGINKPDVRCVIHADIPESLEAYYQEAGRAGRDGEKSFAVALYQQNELDTLEKQVHLKYFDKPFLQSLYQKLSNYFQLAEGAGEMEVFDFDLIDFCSTFGLNATEIFHALKLLESQGFISLSDAFYSPPRLKIELESNDLYSFYLRNPSYEKFIKTILRIYGGEVFTNFLKINEGEIGRAFFANEYEIRKMLSHLNQLGVVTYQEQRNKPKLTFLTYRYDAQKLPINEKLIVEKKAIELASVKKTVEFILEKSVCRMLLLQHYFGDYTQIRCGVCDNCLKQKKKENQTEKYAIYRMKLFEIAPVKAETILENPVFDDIPFLKKVIADLLEKEEMRVTELGVLEKRK